MARFSIALRPVKRKLLAEPPPQAFIDSLRQHGVSPLAIGSVIVATERS